MFEKLFKLEIGLVMFFLLEETIEGAMTLKILRKKKK